jgi:ribose 5-phosphate isomerase B
MQLTATLKDAGFIIMDFGANKLDKVDDYPDFVAPLARAVARGDLNKVVAICGSGVGTCIAANKIPGARAALITDPFSAHQCMKDDNMNIICLGGYVTAYSLALKLVRIFLNSTFKGTERCVRRLRKVLARELEISAKLM